MPIKKHDNEKDVNKVDESIKSRVQTFFQENVTRPLRVGELEEKLELHHSTEFKELIKALNELEETGELVKTRKNRFGLPEKMNLVRGTNQMHMKGIAFLIRDDETEKDIYIHPSDLNAASNNDKVLVCLERSDYNRPEGTVIRILERAVQEVVGTFSDNKSFGFVIADDKRIPNDIFIPKNKTNGAVDGHKVIAQITKYPENQKSAEGEITQILGHKNDPGID